MRVDVDLLGRFSLAVDGRVVPDQAWRRRSAASLVKLLALRQGRRLPREQVVDLLWPDLLLDQAAPRLHKAAHYARVTTGAPECVVLSGEVVSLFPGAEVVVDVDRFERAVGDYQSAGDLACAEKAIGLYAGDLLPDDLYEPWTETDRHRLRLCYLELLRGTGRWSDLVAAEPLDEEAHLALVHHHLEHGDRGGALRALDAMEQLWREELGAPPGPAARAARAEVEAMPAVPARSSGRVRARLPRPATPTVGREHDVRRVLEALEQSRLVTLLGTGGVGKTRLAAEVAHRYTEATGQDGCFVDLTKVREAGLVAELTVRELGIRTGSSENVVPALEEALRHHSLLLVLDNFEHVVDAADLVARMLQWSPDLRVLVTSRARLRLAGEHVYDVDPLHGTTDAVALFEQVAAAIDPRLELAQHREDVAAICRSVDGLPLAIEIAAGHLRALPPQLLRARLADRLASAAAAGRDVPDRQQTIRATIDWSLALLGPADRRLFAALAVFNGAVPLEAVEAISEDSGVVDALSRLVDQSLVRRTTGNRDEPRFAMLQLVRDHARTLGGEEREAVASRHAEYVASFAEDRYARRWTDATDRWVDDLTEALSEIRAAHRWATGRGELRIAARITGALGSYWHLEGHHAEGRRWVAEILDREAELDPEVAARVRLAAGFLEFPRSQPEARVHWARATELFRVLDDSRLLAYSLAVKSATYLSDTDEHERAMMLNDEALALARRVGEPALIAQVLNVRGELTRVAGQDALARTAYDEGLRISTDLGDEIYVSVFLSNLSYIALHRADHEEARRLTREALGICWSLGRRLMAAWTISELAGPELGVGNAERGAQLIGAADEALRVFGSARHPGDLPEHYDVVGRLRAELGDGRYEQLHAAGGRMSLDEAVALALDDAPGRPPS